MKLGFEEAQSPYVSGSQSAKAWTEGWVRSWGYCPNCGHRAIKAFPPNRPVADFFCQECYEEFELKSQKANFGRKIVDGALRTMKERLSADNNPNLMLLNYNRERLEVRNFCIVPKQFFVDSIIEERPPLASTARRAGWVGCNILLDQIPDAGKIFVVQDREVIPRELVLERWKSTLFLRSKARATRGWLTEVMVCVDEIGREEFTLSEVYEFENRLQRVFPENRFVKPKVRQQLQVLRDQGYLEFVGSGRYRLRDRRLIRSHAR